MEEAFNQVVVEDRVVVEELGHLVVQVVLEIVLQQVPLKEIMEELVNLLQDLVLLEEVEDLILLVLLVQVEQGVQVEMVLQIVLQDVQ